MVDIRNIENLQKSRAGGAEKSPQQEAKGASKLVWTLLRDNLMKGGLNVRSLSDLGPFVQDFMQQLVPELLGSIDGTGKVPPDAIKSALDMALSIQKKESHVETKPASVSTANGELHKKLELRDAGDGKQKVVGEAAAKTHGLSILLEGLGLNLGGLEQPVADIIGKAAGSRNFSNLGRTQTWQKVGRDVLAAVLGTPGTPQVKGASAAAAGLAALGDALNEAPSDPPQLTGGPQLGLGMEKKASTQTGVGTKFNATNVRAALMAGVQSQSQVVERTAGDVASAVYEAMGKTPDKPTRTRIHKALTGLIRDRSSATGHVEPTELMARAVKVLAEKDPTHAPLVELADLVQRTKQQDPNVQVPEGFDEAFANLAAHAMGDVVALEMGEKPSNADSLRGALEGAMAELVGAKSTTHTTSTQTQGTAEPGATEAPDLSPWMNRTDIPEPFLRQAVSMLSFIGVNGDHPKIEPMMNALGEIMGATAIQGQFNPVGFAIGLQEFLVAHAGGSEQEVGAVAASLQKLAGALQTQAQHLEQLKTEKAGLEKKYKTSASAAKEHEPRLAELAKSITLAEDALRTDNQRFMGEVEALVANGMSRLAAFMTEGVGGTTHQAAAAGGGFGGGTGGGGPGGPGGVGGGGGPDGPEGGSPFGRSSGGATMGIMPGLNMGGRPEDALNGKNLTIQQRRAIKCGEILADPSLTIEDKIFLFMMWFVAFADEEREKKMEELVMMDRDTARLQKAKDDKHSDLKSQEKTLVEHEALLKSAQTKVQSLENKGVAEDHPDMLAAKDRLGTFEKNVQICESKVAKLEHELNALQRDEDYAPKSREVLFMEIERMNQMRDKIMNMARSIMENSNRNIEKVFR